MPDALNTEHILEILLQVFNTIPTFIFTVNFNIGYSDIHNFANTNIEHMDYIYN